VPQLSRHNRCTATVSPQPVCRNCLATTGVPQLSRHNRCAATVSPQLVCRNRRATTGVPQSSCHNRCAATDVSQPLWNQMHYCNVNIINSCHFGRRSIPISKRSLLLCFNQNILLLRSGVKLLDAAVDKSFSYQSGYLSKKNTFQKG
jgi:hypothetical protein